MCRIVQDVQLPLFKYTPVEPLTLAGAVKQQERPHRPCDLIPNILPEPSRTTNRKDFLSAVTDKSLQAKISKIFGFDKGANDGQKVDLQTKEVRRYTLNNPGEYFNALMKDELYERDVRAFLKETGQAYLVIGFLTTSNATWTHDGSGSSSLEVQAKAPVSMVAAGFGVPLPPVVDPSFTIKRNAGYEANAHHESPDEEIFAVAYAPVKTSGFGFRKAKAVTIGRSKAAGANHLAFGESDDEEEDEDEDEDDYEDEDEEVGFGKKKVELEDHEIQLDENDSGFAELLNDDGIAF